MKIILLATSTTIGGAIVTAIDGPQIVSDETAAYLEAQGLLDGDPEDVPSDDVELSDGLDDMTVADLKLLAADEGIDLGTATKKADIVGFIRAFRVAA